MLVFGIDVPLVEVIFTLAIIMFIILIEIIVVVVLLINNLKESKKLGELLNNLAKVLLDVKKEEIKEIERLKR
ncbi:hypothetical protein HOC13_02520 [Candidatus Woesearchaeota archaeon]|jgi:hypothetical protein|nr:hypothetical protein [Candidatus Woesearchaeota archaeon]